MRVERCGKEHLDIVYEIEKDAFNDPMKKETMEKDLKRESHYCYGIFDDEMIGFLSFDKVFDEGQIISVAIRKDMQKKGYGRKLFEGVKEFAKKDGINLFTLEVRSDNYSAVSLYRALGFCEVGLRRGYYNNPVCNAILMDLKI